MQAKIMRNHQSRPTYVVVNAQKTAS